MTLSGQLGLAQLGAAQLGAFQTITIGAGFPLFFPDVGPVKQATAPKKKAKKPKVKKPKKPKRVRKLRASLQQFATPECNDLQHATPEPVPGFILPELILGESVDTAAHRLRETITEEDELLLLLC